MYPTSAEANEKPVTNMEVTIVAPSTQEITFFNKFPFMFYSSFPDNLVIKLLSLYIVIISF